MMKGKNSQHCHVDTYVFVCLNAICFFVYRQRNQLSCCVKSGSNSAWFSQTTKPGNIILMTAVHDFVKTGNFEAPQLPATDPEIRQHLTFSSLPLKLLIYHFRKAYLFKHFVISDCSMSSFTQFLLYDKIIIKRMTQTIFQLYRSQLLDVELNISLGNFY